jgi:hypothetical protein
MHNSNTVCRFGIEQLRLVITYYRTQGETANMEKAKLGG